MSVYVERFEFLVRHGDADRWVRLQAVGADAVLYQVRPRELARVEYLAGSLLRRARASARIDGVSETIYREPACDGIEEIRPLPGAIVMSCRALGFTKAAHGQLRAHQRPPLEVLAVASCSACRSRGHYDRWSLELPGGSFREPDVHESVIGWVDGRRRDITPIGAPYWVPGSVMEFLTGEILDDGRTPWVERAPCRACAGWLADDAEPEQDPEPGQQTLW